MKKTAAFLYCWTNKVNGKKYVGYHVGDEYDGYTTSSTDPELLEAFAKGEMVREILARGTHADMIYEERKLLTAENAKDNPMYYNKSNGGGLGLKGVIPSTLDEFEESIKNKEYYVNTQTPIEELQDLANIQSRAESIISSHQRTLIDMIDENHGDTSDYEPIVVLDDYFDNGEKLVLDGNHRLSAAKHSKWAKRFPTQYVPKTAWKPFADHLQTLANRLNPIDAKPREATSKETQVKWVCTRFLEQGIEIDSAVNREELQRQNLTTKAINGIFKTAAKQIQQQQHIRPGHSWIDWTSRERRKETNLLIENEQDKDTIAIVMSSAKFSWDVIISKTTISPAKKRIRLFIHHPSWEAKQAWEREYLAKHYRQFEHWAYPIGYHIDIQYLDTEQPDGLHEKENGV